MSKKISTKCIHSGGITDDKFHGNITPIYPSITYDYLKSDAYPRYFNTPNQLSASKKIASFCKENYGVSFPMMSKISVKGSSIHPVYKFLTKKSENGVMDSSVSWNFQKYLIDENGFIVRVVSPRTKPDDQSIIDWISS